MGGLYSWKFSRLNLRSFVDLFIQDGEKKRDKLFIQDIYIVVSKKKKKVKYKTRSFIIIFFNYVFRFKLLLIDSLIILRIVFDNFVAIFHWYLLKLDARLLNIRKRLGIFERGRESLRKKWQVEEASQSWC